MLNPPLSFFIQFLLDPLQPSEGRGEVGGGRAVDFLNARLQLAVLFFREAHIDKGGFDLHCRGADHLLQGIPGAL